MLYEQALKYAENVTSGKEITTDEVRIQCKWFFEDIENKDDEFKFYLDFKKIKKIETILKLLNFATGLEIVGKNVLENLADFQAFFLLNVFGWRFKNNKDKFRYRDVTLFIPRKNSKTWLTAIIFIILLIVEDYYSEFYSICLDRELAGEVKKAMTQIINMSPQIENHFKISPSLAGKITCKLTNSTYQARTAEANKNNSIRPSAYIADEIGAFKDYTNLNAMKSGQLSVKNPLRFKLTTAYAESQSIMISELEYIRKVFDGREKDDRMFALLYYAIDSEKWTDTGLYMSNPLRIEANYNEIRDNCKKALANPLEQTEFLTKHMNIFVQNKSEARYMNMELWDKNIGKVDFKGKHVSIGVDLSITTDLTAVSIMCKDGSAYQLSSHGFLPSANLETRREDIDYRIYEKLGYCTICDGHTINYIQVEEYIRAIEDTYDCTIDYIVSDPYNALEMMQRLANDYTVILIKQNYSTLSPSIKAFRDDVYYGNIKHEKNELLDWCTANAVEVRGKVTEDILLAKENKNKQRIDLLMASIFSYSQLYLQKFDVNKYLSDEYMNKLYGGD